MHAVCPVKQFELLENNHYVDVGKVLGVTYEVVKEEMRDALSFLDWLDETIENGKGKKFRE